MGSNFAAVIWPEHEMPAEAAEYEKCEVCTPRSRVIWGEGNPEAPVLVILDNPGAREDRDGREYVCGTRCTLQEAIHRVGLAAGDVYLTYLLKCRPLCHYDREKARAFSKPFLVEQIRNIDPDFIVCLGDVVVRWMFESAEPRVKYLRGKWHLLMGLPTMVSYHPLAIRRRPNLMKPFLEDWRMLAERFAADRPGN